MDLKANWKQIRATFDAALKSSMHCAIATTDADGNPHVTPIGFIFLRDDYTAFYFEEHARKLPRNLQQNPRVCLLLVNTSRRLWATALLRGRFRLATRHAPDGGCRRASPGDRSRKGGLPGARQTLSGC